MTALSEQETLARPEGLAVAALTLVFALIHLAMAGLIPVFQDEAYYALWATRLAPDYYDHPPMIALWIRAGEEMFGPGPEGIRFLCVLGFAATTALTCDIARLLGADGRRAVAAGLFFNVMLLPAALGFAATPDAPSVFFWALTLWLMLRAVATEVATERGATWIWALAGLAAGAGVLSKFTNLFLIAGLFVWFIGTRRGRRLLDDSGPWVMAVAAAAVLAPFVDWNAIHGWYGFARQFGRLGGAATQGDHLAEYLATTLLSTMPLLAWPVWRAARRARGEGLILVATTAPFLMFLAYHALHARIQANWIVPVTPALAVLAALGLRRPTPALIGLIAAAGGGFSALCLALALWPGVPFFPGDNPANQTKGWDAFTETLAAVAERDGAAWIATTDYGTTGELALRLPGLPVWQVTEPQRYLFRGPVPRGLCPRPGLLVSALDAGGPDPGALFHTVGRAIGLARFSERSRIRNYRVTQVAGLRACTKGGGARDTGQVASGGR
ncbi:ArnT family glycosyltransferase [Acidimangrovimonas sediminis]|uniref:ArnT family glycosyltransferase n=1 Tax=Acidimangrovimonas sediminis TaxID=2056283 RepID=UPI000C7FA66B|nr:glycosyltransferase family 39 protein [Acidimangrovimonas sediminis]